MATKKKSSKSLPLQTKPPATPESLRVLVADDHDIVHHGLKQLLSDHFGAITFGEARNAQDALDQCVAQEWSVMLLDITMPGRSGLDILADLKRIRPTVPVLIMSAFPEEEFALRALKSGAAGYLDKRTLAGEIVTAIKRVTAGEQTGGATGRRRNTFRARDTFAT